MSNPTFKPSEGKREEFRNYLEKNGVMDALTKVLVNLYEEADKPDNALEYVREKLAVQAGIETYSQMKEKLEEYSKKIDELTEKQETKESTTPAEDTQQEDEDMEASIVEVDQPAADLPSQEEKKEEPDEGAEPVDQPE